MCALKFDGIIFDLDMTLVDSRCIAHHHARFQRTHFAKAIEKVPLIVVYPGVRELLASASAKGLPTIIVTNSKGDYCNAVVKHHRLPVKDSICFGDTERRKPHPEPMLLAAKRLNISPDKIVAIGDRHYDIAAANEAGMISVAALWACTAPASVKAANPAHLCSSVEEFARLVGL